MANLHLTLACGDYDLTRPLLDGTVGAQGIDLTVLTMPSPERHWRFIRHGEFDICELSMSSYLMARAAGRPFNAIPVFPHRRFRHSYIFVNADAGVREPRDLMGKAVGLRTFQTTAGLWTMGILQEHYGVDLRSVRWFTQDEEDIPFTPPPGLHLQRLPPDKSIDRMLVEGELAAVIYPEILPALARGSAKVRRLFSDYRREEMEYFRKTGIFPIMHTVVIREAVLEQHPWVARNVHRAFQRAKELAYRRLEDPRTLALAWVMERLEEQKRLLGPDPWAYNLEDNRKNLETLIAYSHDQGLIDRLFPLEELFFPSSLDQLPAYAS